MIFSSSARSLQRFAEIIGCLAIGALLSLHAGQDASWDLRNYHLYNAFSFFHDRMDVDFFPDDKHAGLNPLLDFIYTYLALGPLSHFPRVLAALMGLWYGALLLLLLAIIRLLFSHYAEYECRILIPLCVITAATGGMALSQIGTSSNDIAIAVIILGGLLIILKTTHSLDDAKKPYLFAGFLFGFAAGAKLTALIYTPALALALLLSLPLRHTFAKCALISAGWITGFLLSFGWWGWMMWQRFANPVFPLMNGFFKSPLGPAFNLNDERFFPRTFLQKIAYPFFWAWDKSNHLVYEFDFCDPRMAIVYAAIIILIACALFNRVRARQGKSLYQNTLSLEQKITLLFFIFSYLAWLTTTSILRYAVVLECLAIPLFISIVMGATKATTRFKLSFIAVVCLLCLLTTRYSDWGHRSFSDKVIDVDISWVEPNTLFLSVYEPVAYLAAAMPEELHTQFAGLGFISYLHGFPLGYTGERLIRNHQGPIVVLFREKRRQYLSLLEPFGLSSNVTNCHILTSNLSPLHEPPVMACETPLSLSFH